MRPGQRVRRLPPSPVATASNPSPPGRNPNSARADGARMRSIASARRVSGNATLGARLACMAAKALNGDAEELRRARELRLAADRAAPMSERLARAHALCKQLSAIKGAAARPR